MRRFAFLGTSGGARKHFGGVVEVACERTPYPL